MAETRKFRVTTVCPDCNGTHCTTVLLPQALQLAEEVMRAGHKMVMIEDEATAMERDADMADEEVGGPGPRLVVLEIPLGPN